MTPTLNQVRELANVLDREGIERLHVDRKFIRAWTLEQWTPERKAAWKAAARELYPWAKISMYGPNTYQPYGLR